jgi:hypothetical protein
VLRRCTRSLVDSWAAAMLTQTGFVFRTLKKTHNKGLWMYMENKDNGEKFSNADAKQWNEARKKSHPEAK